MSEERFWNTDEYTSTAKYTVHALWIDISAFHFVWH